MSKPLVIIADLDEDYLLAIEKKILKEIGNQIELEVITDAEYFAEFISVPKTAEILLVGEDLYTSELKKHNLSHIFILTEEVRRAEEGTTTELLAEDVNRYASTNEIYNQIIRYSRDSILQDAGVNKETRVIAFYSAIGGTGKTALSMGLAKSLADKYHRVLYINTESVQSFGFYLPQRDMCLPEEGYRSIRSARTAVYSNLKAFLQCDGFYFVPPMLSSLDARNLSYDIYKNLIVEAKQSRDFDYIVVDIEAGYSNQRIDLMAIADKVLFVVLPDAISATKMHFLEQNISISDKDKYICVCNRCKKGDMDMERNLSAMSIVVQEMVYEAEETPHSISELAELKGMKALVQGI